MAARNGGTVIFANFISNYQIALYVTEATSKDLNIRCADGYLEKYDEFDFEIVRGLAPYIGRSWSSIPSITWRKPRISSR